MNCHFHQINTGIGGGLCPLCRDNIAAVVILLVMFGTMAYIILDLVL